MNTFPLNQLPQDVFLRTIQSMDIQEQLAYSLCSKNTKKLIKSLNLRAEKINLNVNDLIEIEIRFGNSISFWSFTKHGNTFPNNEFRPLDEIKVYVLCRARVMSGWIWQFPNFELKDWLYHFCEVLHHPKIDCLYFSGETLDDNYIEPVQKVIKGLQVGCLLLSDDLTNDFAKKALERFPNYEKLALFQVPFGRDHLNKLLVQNLKSVFIPVAQRLKIDQILLTNSQRIQQNSSMFTEKDFNRFLKLWIRGSNPNLRFYFTRGQLRPGKDSLDMNLILKGIKYEQVPLDSQEVHREKVNEHIYNETRLAGGSRIWSFNGTTAVIVVTENIFKFILEGIDSMYVF
ncbi:unnamed protein product [Caenorhabditis brenneri]